MDNKAYARVTVTLDPNDARQSVAEVFIEIDHPPLGMDEAGAIDYVTQQASKLEPGARTLFAHFANVQRDLDARNGVPSRAGADVEPGPGSP